MKTTKANGWALALAVVISSAGACASDSLTPTISDQNIDLIIEGDWVLTMNDGEAPLADGAVAVNNGEIIDVGPRAQIHDRYSAATTLPGDQRIVMPGLVNGHTHASMVLLRGVADDLPLREWLEKYIFPAEVRLVDADFVRVGTELACWEMIRGGTTTFVDMYYFPDTVAEVVESCGMRAIVVPGVIDQPSPDASDGKQSLAQAIAFAKRWKDRNSRITPSIGGHAIYTLKPETLRNIRDAAAQAGVPVGIHLAESAFEVSFADEAYSATPIEFLNSLDFFSNKVIGAHVVYPTESDQITLRKHGVGAIHNPTSNMKISSGIAPVTQMLANGVLVGLGTDGAASNNDLDMWEEIRLAAFLQKVATMDPESLPARTALKMATKGGAEAIGLGHQTGSITKGLRADLIQISTADLSFVPMYDPISHLAYVADEHDVTTVVIDGQMVMLDKQILTLDEEKIRREAGAWAEKIQATLNAPPDIM